MGLFKRWRFERMRRRRERFPSFLSIELTTLCNARCSMCPRDKMERRDRDMSMETLERLIESLRGKPIRKANVFWMGDPFASKRFLECARRIRSKLPRLRLYASTNCGALNENTVKAIVDEQLLHMVNLDIDATTSDVHAAIRRGVGFDRALRNARFLVDYRRERRKRFPKIRATMIRMESNEHQVDEFKRFWGPLADKVDITRYHTWLGELDEPSPDGGPAKGEANGGWDFACRHPWDEAVIAVDGRVGLCCLDHDLSVVLGDLNEQTLEEIWTGPVITDVRRKLLELRYDEIPPCSRCGAHVYQQNNSWTRMQR